MQNAKCQKVGHEAAQRRERPPVTQLQRIESGSVSSRELDHPWISALWVSYIHSQFLQARPWFLTLEMEESLGAASLFGARPGLIRIMSGVRLGEFIWGSSGVPPSLQIPCPGLL